MASVRGELGKLPWRMFFPSDYISDTRVLSLAARGLTMDLNCHLWRSSTPGTLAHSPETWARLVGVNVEEFHTLLAELEDFSIFDIETDGKGHVRVSSRRILREEKKRQNNALYQREHRRKRKVRAASGQNKADSQTQTQSQNQRPKSETQAKDQTHMHNHLHSHHKPEVNVEQIVYSWNKLAGVTKVISKNVPGTALETRILQLIKEHPKAVWWQELLTHVANSSFLTGHTYDRQEVSFYATLEYVLKAENLGTLFTGGFHAAPNHPDDE